MMLTACIGIVCIGVMLWWWHYTNLRDFRSDATVGMYCRFHDDDGVAQTGRIVSSGVYAVVILTDAEYFTRNRSEIWPA